MLIAFENAISLSAHILILSAHVLIAFENTISLFAHTLILSAHALIVFENRISLSARTLIAFANALIVFENRIRLSTRTLILSAHALIAFENLLGLFARALILSARPLIVFTLPSGTAYSPTVPSGDTPCLTAGDARRANPWTDNSANLRHRRCRTAARFCTSELLLHAFSATPPASECPLSTSPTGSPSLCSGITRGYAWCASAGGVTLCGCGGGAVGEGIHKSIHTIEK